MRISIRNADRQPLFDADADLKERPAKVSDPAGRQPDVFLEWEQAVDDQGYLRRCPVCGCRELFVRKDFPQVTGFVIVAATAALSIVLLGMHLLIAALAVLAAVAVVDSLIYLFTGRCLVCYRCRSEFRRLPIRKDHPRWQLATGEKYRAAPTDTTAV